MRMRGQSNGALLKEQLTPNKKKMFKDSHSCVPNPYDFLSSVERKKEMNDRMIVSVTIHF